MHQITYSEYKTYEERGNTNATKGNIRVAINDYISGLRVLKKSFNEIEDLQSTYYNCLNKVIELEARIFPPSEKPTNLIMKFLEYSEEFLIPTGALSKTSKDEECYLNAFETLSAHIRRAANRSLGSNAPCMEGRGCALKDSSTGVPMFDEESAENDPRHIASWTEFGKDCKYRILRDTDDGYYFVCPKTFSQPPSIFDLFDTFLNAANKSKRGE